MIVIIILSTIICRTRNQGTVQPKTSTCGCTNLLNQNDCEAMNCEWNIIDTSQDSSPDSTDTTNTTNSTNQTSASITGLIYIILYFQIKEFAQIAHRIVQILKPIPIVGLCTKPLKIAIPLQDVLGILLAKHVESLRDVQPMFKPLIPFASQYLLSVHQMAPNALILYPVKITRLKRYALVNQSQQLDNIASSGAKQCKWSNSTCVDLTCSDAPSTYTTQSQCTGWISNCLTTGKGCTSSLQLCSTYLVSAGCLGMIGSDGKCASTTGQTNCRPLNCSDAGATLNTNSACNSFLSGCLTTGKGCAQTLALCNTYLQTAGCTGLIGSDGPCIADAASTTKSCRLLQCTDASSSIITNQGCNNFLSGCVTTGQGCIKTLSTCSSYTGTSSSCALYVGTDGNCKGGSTSPGPCAPKVCSEAPSTFNTNSACAVYQSGCITTGAGCTNVLGSCSSYTGTQTTCSQYIGIDGSCASTSINSGPCVAKVCSDAPATLTTSFACQQYSYNCVTNGAGCILPGQCSSITIAISCQGSSQCQTSSVCINRSSCTNYSTQSQCQLNTQQFQANGTILVRPCIWDGVNNVCQNTLCPTTATLTSDSACGSALSGCLTNGAGCIESSADCPQYSGTSTTCSAFRGNFGTNICFSTSNTVGPCSTKTCSSAPAGQTSGLTCSQWLTGCLYNGNGGCVTKSVDCTNYYGTQSYCASIATSVSGGKPQPCYNIISAIATTQCLVKTCDQAVPAGSTQFNTNALCNSFLAGCVTNGYSCVSSTSSCTTYSGTLSQCSLFTSNSKGCTKTSNFCRPASCTNHSPPSSVSTTAAQGFYCQTYIDSSGYNCQGGTTCVTALVSTCPSFISIGSNAIAQQLYCYNLKLPGTAKCGYASGQSCTPAACNQFTPVGTTADEKATYCKSFTTNTSGIQFSCGLFIPTSQTCSTRTCSDYGVTQADCSSYTSNCSYSSLGFCYTKQVSCNSYTIPATNNGSELSKAQYCASLISTAASNNQCGYSSAAPTICASPVAACNNFQWASSLTVLYDRLQWCRASKDQAGNQCAYLGGAATTCAVLGLCTTYTPQIESGQTASDYLKQLSCANQVDSNNKACSFITGGTNCSAQQASCSSYNTYGTVQQNQYMCSQLLAGTTRCGYNEVPGTATVCNNLSCSDIATNQSMSKCKSYNSSCLYDGANCVKVDSCSNYTAQQNGLGQPYNCQQLYDTNNNQCVYGSGNNCKSKACSDLTTGQSASTCSNYLSTCQYNGSNCITTGSCSSYSPSGNTNDLKAQVCNSLIDNTSAKCSYIAGSSFCTASVQCSQYNISSFSSVTPIQGCSLLQDSSGAQCGYTQGPSCTIRQCSQALYASSDADCNTYMSGCEQDTSTSCSLLACNSAPSTLTTDAACKIFRYGCVTNGAGCLEQTDSCSSYQGTQITCSQFKSIAVDGTITLCYNSASATSSTQCANKLCTDNTTATSDTDCAIFYPPQSNGSKVCVFNGTLGCTTAATTCQQFSGTIDTCSTFSAIDGPCIGTGNTPAPCNPRTCLNAPTSYNTDKQCKAWLQSCMTNGFGCITQSTATCSSIQVSSACQQYQKVSGLFCDQAQQCISKMSNCSSYTTPSNCNNVPLLGSSSPGCGWSTQQNSCIPINCSLLPTTLVTDASCSAALSTCTTNKAGCVTKGPCNSYDKLSCGVAATTDVAGKCIWSNSACRQIQCTDNTSALSDTSCNSYLKGCKTTGQGCASTISCNIITIQSNCLKDSQGLPCLWYNNKCISYSKCQDVSGTTLSACQQISKLCTTDGVSCIPITSCAKTIKQASCITGIDGQCGWQSTGTTSGTCSLFTKCSDASLKTTENCKLWGSKCISNGTSCMDQANCSTYTNKISCQSGGLDGLCSWTDEQGTNPGSCRVQQCTDATTNISTFEGCQQFSNSCTTNGTNCIQLSQCSSYTTKLGCVLGIDGDCLWAATGNSNEVACRLKQCPDIIKITSSDCQLSSNKLSCVSNGVNCIQKSNCSSYTYKESCLGGGTDGQCAFIPTPNSTTPIGTCLYFKECSIADSDQVACLSRQDACYWNSTTINGTTTTQCVAHTCSTKAKGSTCQAVPSFDLSTYQLCVLNGTTCGPGVLTSLSSSNCFMSSQWTATWNPQTSTCQQCIIQNNNTNTTNPNNTNTTNKFAYILAWTLIFSF